MSWRSRLGKQRDGSRLEILQGLRDSPIGTLTNRDKAAHVPDAMDQCGWSWLVGCGVRTGEHVVTAQEEHAAGVGACGVRRHDIGEAHLRQKCKDLRVLATRGNDVDPDVRCRRRERLAFAGSEGPLSVAIKNGCLHVSRGGLA